jgi:hypothetical protein
MGLSPRARTEAMQRKAEEPARTQESIFSYKTLLNRSMSTNCTSFARLRSKNQIYFLNITTYDYHFYGSILALSRLKVNALP